MKKTITHTLLLFPILAMGIQAQEKQSSPNLIFIMADQWRGDALGCLGKEAVKNTSSGSIGIRRGLTSPMQSAAIRYLLRHVVC